MTYPSLKPSLLIHRQQGMTTIGLLILICFIGLFVYAGIRLVPVYLENFKIIGTLEKVQSEYSGNRPSRTDIMNSIEKRFDVESVTAINYKEVKVRKMPAGYQVTADYTHRVPFVANIEFAVSFENEVLVAN